METVVVRPILFSIGNLYVGSYAAMMFLAVMIAIVSTNLRTRNRSLDVTALVPGLIVALLCGWILSRAASLMDPVVRKEGWRVFSPLHPSGGSLTFFGVGAALGVLGFLILRRKPILPIADAIAPSILLAVGIAKLGCLMGGCCAGATCPRSVGITYPYGSVIHEYQFERGLITLPDELVLAQADPKRHSRLHGHVQLLLIESEAALERKPEDESKGLAPKLISLARERRSLPVWPVPLMASFTAFGCGAIAEFVYRKSRQPGTTIAFVLGAYGAMRLTLDWFLADRGYVLYGLSSAQWVGLVSLLAAVALCASVMHRTKDR